MFQGFYNLASGMLTQNRNLNVLSNNMANMSTPGYKTDTMTSTTFQQEMMYRNGNQGRANQSQIGSINMARVPEQTITNYEQGSFYNTENQLDFAINGNGFFRIQTPGGGYVYTRNGSFSIDEDNCLALAGVGKVQGEGGEIYLETDDFQISSGGIYDAEGELIDNIQVVDFTDYAAMTKLPNGAFAAAGEPEALENPSIMNETLERSNSNVVKDMQDMISTQRSFQSASQVLKMYDQIMSRAVTEIAKF